MFIPILSIGLIIPLATIFHKIFDKKYGKSTHYYAVSTSITLLCVIIAFTFAIILSLPKYETLNSTNEIPKQLNIKQIKVDSENTAVKTIGFDNTVTPITTQILFSQSKTITKPIVKVEITKTQYKQMFNPFSYDKPEYTLTVKEVVTPNIKTAGESAEIKITK